MKFSYPLNKVLICILALFSIQAAAQQQESLVVTRISVIDQRSPVTYIFVDDDNVKWVANSKGVFQLRSSDLANPLALAAGEQSLYAFPGGNFDLKWSAADMNAALGNILNNTNTISAAAYSSARDELWIGTSNSGLHLLKTQPALRKVETFNTSNSKLTSNQILHIFIDKKGRKWVGSAQGVMIGGEGRWALEQKYFAIHRTTEGPNGIWVAGEGQIWQVDSRDRWLAVPLNDLVSEGEVMDIAVDTSGRLWVASESIVRWDAETDKIDRFGPIEYYTSQYATRIALDQDGALWVGTEDKGVFLIDKASALTINVLKEKELSCTPGQNDAALRVKVTGGKGPFTYRWDKGLNGEAPANLGPGLYALTVTDSQGRTKSAKITIEDTRMTARATQQEPESAPNAADAVALAIAEGGMPQFTYAWDNGETANIARKLKAGSHAVTITDKNGCKAVATVNIEQKAAALKANLTQTQPIRCPNDRSAALVVEVFGGKGPFQFKWNQAGLSGEKPVGLAAGNYVVTVTDAAGASASANIEVKSPAALSASAIAVSPASTGNSDGKATVQTTGGNAPYTYLWDNGETTQQAERLAPGNRTVTIKDANGCSATAQINITENILPLTAALSQTANIACSGEKTAALELRVGGGKGPFQFKWNQAGLSGEKPVGLAAGNYVVTVTDAAGASASANIEVKSPAALSASAIAVTPASTGNSDGKATVQITGGNAPFSYLWDNGETAQQAERLAPGTRTVTIKDANGCSATAQINITENILPLTAALSQTANIACLGEKTAALELRIGGGKGPFQFKWNQAGLSGEKPVGLAAGNYVVTVTDAAGASASANIEVKSPAALSASAIAVKPASTGNSDGKATVQISGGNAPYTYLWDNGETAQQAERLAPGNRTVTIKDANGCSATAQINITENILPLTAALSQTVNIACSGEKTAALELRIGGGKGPFQFKWNQAGLSGEKPVGLAAGNYAVTVTDAAGASASANIEVKSPAALNASATAVSPASTGNSDGKATVQVSGGNAPFSYLWDNGETAQQAERLAPGTRTVTVKDANGCSATAQINITENILPLTAALSQTANIACSGDKTAALELRVGGGKGPFQFKWNQAGLSGEKPVGLAAGNYVVTVTDAAGASASANIEVKSPAALSASAIAVSPASTGNSDGKAAVQIAGGNAPFSYLWDNGETAQQAERLAPGTRTVTIKDANGCSATAQINITENILPLTAALSQTANIACSGDKTAALELRVGGGKGPFQFKWNQAGLSGEKPVGLAAGNYVVTVTDAAGASASANIEVKSPAALSASAIAVSPASTGNSDGKAAVQIAGGNAPFSYLWDNGETAQQAERLAPGTRTVTIKDANGCSATAQINITENILPLTAALSQTANIACSGEKTAALELRIGGGKGPFQFKWNQAGLSGEKPVGLAAGNYAVTVTDALGAEKTASITITEPAAFTAAMGKKRGASTETTPDGRAIVTAQGGTAPYSYRWDNGETTSQAERLPAGNHAVTISDAGSCTQVLSVEIPVRILPELTAGLLQTGQAVRMEQLQFDADSMVLKPSFYPLLDELYDFLDENQGVVVEIGGHTNSLPPDAVCDNISTARAKVVAEYLIAKGISDKRVFHKGYGKRQPIASNTTPEGRRRNQRVEVKILRLSGEE